MTAQHFAKLCPNEGGGELQAFLVRPAGKVAAFGPLESVAARRDGQPFGIHVHHQRFVARLAESETVSLKQELKDLLDLLKMLPLQNMQGAIDGTLTGKG